jgi:hypothetical protein
LKPDPYQGLLLQRTINGEMQKERRRLFCG